MRFLGAFVGECADVMSWEASLCKSEPICITLGSTEPGESPLSPHTLCPLLPLLPAPVLSWKLLDHLCRLHPLQSARPAPTSPAATLLFASTAQHATLA